MNFFLLTDEDIEIQNVFFLLKDKYSFIYLPLKKFHPSIEKVKRYIEEKYNQPLSFVLLAEIACMSKYHFCRTFKKYVGMSCTKYINLIRVREAKRQLLESKLLSITEICFSIGYNDLTYFERVFKKLESCSPSEYRNKFNPS